MLLLYSATAQHGGLQQSLNITSIIPLPQLPVCKAKLGKTDFLKPQLTAGLDYFPTNSYRLAFNDCFNDHPSCLKHFGGCCKSNTL